MNLKLAHELAIDAASKAGVLLKQGLNEAKEISLKKTAVDLVTQYDRASQQLILNKIRNQFPEHQIVAEEYDEFSSTHVNQAAEYTWYIDPLDGTNNFAHRYPIFSVSIALYYGFKPLVAVVYDPGRDECFNAVFEGGAFVRTTGNETPLKVSETKKLLSSLLATGFPDNRHHSEADNIAQTRAFLKRALGIRRAGSAALDLAYVAAGRLDGYWEYKINSWDIAAGILLVQEAGGRLSRADGHALQLSTTNAVIASNGWIHQEMVDVLSEFA